MRRYRRGMCLDRLTSNRLGISGTPCIRDLRVTVNQVLSQPAGGETVVKVLAEFPYLERADSPAASACATAATAGLETDTPRRRQP